MILNISTFFLKLTILNFLYHLHCFNANQTDVNIILAKTPDESINPPILLVI